MIQRESGVLCDATSLALNVFDILKCDAIRRRGWTGTNHLMIITKGVVFRKKTAITSKGKKRVARKNGQSKSASCVPVKKERPQCRSAMGDRRAITCSGGKGCSAAPASEKTGHEDNPWTPAHPHTQKSHRWSKHSLPPAPLGQFWGTLGPPGKGLHQSQLLPSSCGRPAGVGVLHRCSSQILDRVMCLSNLFSIQQPVPRSLTHRPGSWHVKA